MGECFRSGNGCGCSEAALQPPCWGLVSPGDRQQRGNAVQAGKQGCKQLNYCGWASSLLLGLLLERGFAQQCLRSLPTAVVAGLQWVSICHPTGSVQNVKWSLSLSSRSRTVGRNTCLGIASHALPEHRVTFPIPAE